ncbi:MAG: hypothetical protein ACKVVP_05375 [Chloroflexota bacterium]
MLPRIRTVLEILLVVLTIVPAISVLVISWGLFLGWGVNRSLALPVTWYWDTFLWFAIPIGELLMLAWLFVSNLRVGRIHAIWVLNAATWCALGINFLVVKILSPITM